MSYEKALEAAGATIHAFESFGSYQGDWWALVTAGGVTGWVSGSFGSCSGCDAFEAEFGYADDKCSEHEYSKDCPTCEPCKAKAVEFQSRLASFGGGYLDSLMSQDEAEKRAAQSLEWDGDAQQMLDWVKAHSVESIMEPK